MLSFLYTTVLTASDIDLPLHCVQRRASARRVILVLTFRSILFRKCLAYLCKLSTRWRWWWRHAGSIKLTGLSVGCPFWGLLWEPLHKSAEIMASYISTYYIYIWLCLQLMMPGRQRERERELALYLPSASIFVSISWNYVRSLSWTK